MSCTRTIAMLMLSALMALSAVHASVRPRVVVVLSGGGARGIAQIGVLRELERSGIRPDAVVGTSIGAIIGGMYCAGYTPDELDSIFNSIDWDYIVAVNDANRREHLSYQQKQDDDRSLLTLRFRNFSFLVPTAVSGSARFATLLQDILWKSPYNTVTDFDDLHIPFRAVATDLATGSWVALDSGNLATALRASASFPLRYAPYRDGARMLVDGGLVANIPIEPALSLDPEIVIVVNTVADLLPIDEITTPWAVADQALSSAMKQRDSVMLRRADIVITPALGSHSTFDFTGIDSVIRIGAEGAQRSLAMIKQRIGATADHSATNGAIIRSIALHGAMSTDMSAALRIDAGTSATRANIEHLTADLIRLLHEAGLDFAFVRSTSFDVETGILHVTVDEGRVASIEIDPVRSVSFTAVDHELTFDVGDLLTRYDVSRSAANLRSSDLLDDVDITVMPDATAGCRVIIGAVDRGNQLMRIGVRIDNERNAQGGAQATQLDLLGTGVSADLRLAGGQRNSVLMASLEVPRILGSFWTARASAYTSERGVYVYTADTDRPRTTPLRVRNGEFSEDRYGMRLSFGRQLERQGVVLGEFRYEQQRYRDRNDSAAPKFTPIATLRGLVRWDDRDKVDFTTHGRAIDLSFESSILNLSNEVSFTKIMLSLQGAISITPTIALIPKVLIGAADRTLPSPELFSLGGQEVFFGMREDEERGRQLVVGQLEARMRMPFRVLFDTYVSLRYDLGAVWANPENIRINDMQHGIGLTIGLDTPVGPALFSVGRRFYVLSSPNTLAIGPLLAYFSIGMRL